MSEWRCLRLRVRGGEDCVICAFHEDLEVLQAWMSRLRGSPIAGSAWRARRARSSFTFSRPAAIHPALGERPHRAPRPGCTADHIYVTQLAAEVP